MNRGKAAVRQLDEDGLLKIVEPTVFYVGTVRFDTEVERNWLASGGKVDEESTADEVVELIVEDVKVAYTPNVTYLIKEDDRVAFVTVWSRDLDTVQLYLDDHAGRMFEQAAAVVVMR